jgi:hypothetical protein
MAYTYRFIPAGDPIQTLPKETFKNAFQENLNQLFYASSDWFTIEEETSFASETYQNVDVRINSLINPTSGVNVEEDYKKIMFKDVDHSIVLGGLYKFDDNFWITINVDRLKTLANTVVVKRCNNTLRWLDEITGALYQVPVSIGYLIKENRDYATAGSAVTTPSGMEDCYFQINAKTNTIQPNQRFLVGNPSNWTGWRVEGGGINNFNNQRTLDNNSAGLGMLTLSADYENVNTDDLVNGIANINTNLYALTLDKSSISGTATQTVQLIPTLTLNGETTTRNLTWASSNTPIATVNSSGLVTFVANGSCVITCSMQGNSTVSDTCSASVVGSPVDTYQVVVSPNTNYILEGVEQTWTVYLYKNNVQQLDAFVFALDSNIVPSANYTYTVLGANSFKIKNIQRFLTDIVEVNCTSGIYSQVVSVSLRGAW